MAGLDVTYQASEQQTVAKHEQWIQLTSLVDSLRLGIQFVHLVVRCAKSL